MTSASELVNEELAAENERLRSKVMEQEQLLVQVGKRVSDSVELIMRSLRSIEGRLAIIESNQLAERRLDETQGAIKDEVEKYYRAAQTVDDWGNTKWTDGNAAWTEARLRGLKKIEKRSTK